MDGSPGAAVELLRRAQQLDPGDAAPDVAVDLAVAHMLAGHLESCEADCKRLLADPTLGDRRTELHYTFIRTLVDFGRSVDAIAEADDFLASDYIGDRRLATQAVRAYSLAQARQLDAAAVAAEAVLAAAGPLDDPAVSHAQLAMSHVDWWEGRHRSATEWARQGAEMSERRPARVSHGAHVTLAFYLTSVGDLDEARRVVERGRRVCEELGCRSHTMTYDFSAGHITLATGDWQQAVLECEREDEPTAGGFTALRLAVSTLAYTQAGRYDDARRALEQARAASHGSGLGGLWVWFTESALVNAVEGEVAALQHLGPEWPSVLVLEPTLVATGFLLRLATGADRPDILAGLVERLEPLETSDILSFRAAAGWARSVADHDVDGAVAAADAIAGTSFTLQQAMAGEDAALLLGAAGDLDAARRRARTALDTYARLGAERERRRFEQSLRSLGVGTGGRRAAARPTMGWESLTPAQASVARLLAKGRTNAAIAEELYVLAPHGPHARRPCAGQARCLITRGARGGLRRFRRLAPRHRERPTALPSSRSRSNQLANRRGGSSSTRIVPLSGCRDAKSSTIVTTAV